MWRARTRRGASLPLSSAGSLKPLPCGGGAWRGGAAPAELGGFTDACPVRVGGLMTMPPFTQDPEASRPYFARLAELAGEHGLSRLSMGTSQDWRVAVQEGATIVRLGTALFV